jgi:N-acetyl-1-D-myo-inositol-2-amino-2-deoxy-alpha-D-glucopyranoside deacetylase
MNAGTGVLAVFAHPDDEALACGGLLARCSTDNVPAAVLCLTRGAGIPADESLAAARTAEFAAAAATLGLTGSALLDYRDGYLPWEDAAAVERDILDTIARLRPELVVTFADDGLYWHPDHIAVHERTTAAVERLGADAPALFYVTMPAGAVRGLVDTVSKRTAGAAPAHVLGIDQPDAFGAETQPATLRLDVTQVAARKLAALRCHASQVADGTLARASERDAADFLGTELYRRAPVGGSHPTLLDRLATPLVEPG